MAVSHQGVYTQTPIITPQSWLNADSANTKKTVCTGGTNGTKVMAVIITSTDTSNRVAQLWLTRSATSYLLGSVAVPTLSGTDGVNATVNMINTTMLPGLPVDNDGQVYLHLVSGDTLQVSITAQVTSAKEIDVTSISANF